MSDKILRGALELPEPVEVLDGIVELRGWVLHPRIPIHAMWAWSEDVRVPLCHGLVRLDVEWQLAEVRGASRSGFVGRVPVPPAARRVQLEVWVELDGGRRVRWLEHSLELVHPEMPAGPIELPGSLLFHLEAPSPGAVVGPTIPVRGWISSPRAGVRRIWATTEDGASFPLRHGVLRPDLLRNRNLHHEPLRGFEGVVVPPPSQPEPQLGFWAELDSGETVLCLTRSVVARATTPTLGASAPAAERWRQTNRLTARLGSALVKGAAPGEGERPLVSFLYAAEDQAALATVLESLRGQLDPRWELCVAFDGRLPGAEPMLRETSFPARVRAIRLPEVAGRVRALKAALDLATAELVAIVGPRGSLLPDAVHQIATYLATHGEIDWLYTDHEEDGRLVLKSDWDPDRALCGDFPGRLSVLRRERLHEIGGLRREHEGAEEWDLYLRLAEQIPAGRIGHLARICYREPGAAPPPDAATRALSEALRRRRLPATVAAGQLSWDRACLSRAPVTVVIPTRDRGDLLRRCVESLRRTVDEAWVQLLIVDDDSSDPATLDYLASLQNCRVIRLEGPRLGFDYARLMNGALAHVETPLLLHLNNDVRALEPGWLEEMVGWLQVPGVGIVGATLIGEDAVVQHAGVVVGPHGGLADHAFAGLSTEELASRHEAATARDVSAVTGACLLIRTELYRLLGGFDGQRFRVDYNDVDLCLRAAAAGFRTLVTPRARLIHDGAASRGESFDPGEHLSFLERHPGIRDRFVNENLRLDSMDLLPDPHRYLHAAHCPSPLKLLVFSEGAPDPVCASLLRTARREHHVVLLAPESDRALELELEEAGVVRARVESNGVDLREGVDLRALGEALELEQFDLVICQGWASHRGIELAAAWRKPSLWQLPEAVLPIEEKATVAAMRRATRVCFSSRATALRFAHANDRDHHRVIEAGAQLRAIGSILQQGGRAARRAMWKLAAGEVAIAVAADRESSAWLDTSAKDAHKARWLPLGRDPRRDCLLTLAAADLLFVPEGVPTLILDAMALGVPVVAPRTQQISEVVSSGAEGLLFTDAADAASLLRRLVDDPAFRRELGRNAAAKARRLFDGDRSLAHTLQLIKEAVLA